MRPFRTNGLTVRLSASGFVVAAFLVADPVTLRFAPAPESSVERSAVWIERTQTEDVALLIDGEPTDQVPTVSTELERELTIESVETFVSAIDGRLVELVRAFGPITMEASSEIEASLPGAGDASFEIGGEGGSELEGVRVRFVWDPDLEEWTKSFADDYEGREELLEPLEPTTELLFALPEDEDVEVDDRWDLDLDVLFDLLRPGGAVPLDVETDLQALEGVLDPILLPGVFDSLDGDREGDVSARVTSADDSRAVIAIAVDAKVTCDHLEGGTIDLEDALPEGARADLARATYETSIDGKGEIVWDLEAGRMASFRFEADVEVEIQLDVDVEAEGEDLFAELREQREGTVEVRIESAEGR